MIKSYNLRKHHLSSLIKSERVLNVNLSAQSVDFFPCKAPPTLKVDNKLTTGFDSPTPKMLICTRNGDIIEINLTYRFKGVNISERPQATQDVTGQFTNIKDTIPAGEKRHHEGEIDQEESEDQEEG